MQWRVNRTEAEAAFQRYSWSCRWKEYWATLPTIEEEEEVIEISFEIKQLKLTSQESIPAPQNYRNI